MKLPYGIQNGKLVSIDEVEQGLACNCYCKKCKGILIARKGDVNKHHFAHYNIDDCGWTGESEIHLMAKEIIAKSDNIKLPKLYWSYNPDVKIIREERQVKIDEVKLEKKLNDIIPDIIIKSGRKQLLIEIKVSHGVTHKKFRKIKKLKLATIEIDARKIVNKLFNKGDYFLKDKTFEDFLINQTEFKYWIYNPKKEKARAHLIKNYAKKLKIKHFNMSDDMSRMFYVDFCPINKRSWKSGFKEGYSYAKIEEDCHQCKYNLGAVFPLILTKHVKCIGHLKSDHDNDIEFIIKDLLT